MAANFLLCCDWRITGTWFSDFEVLHITIILHVIISKHTCCTQLGVGSQKWLIMPQYRDKQCGHSAVQHQSRLYSSSHSIMGNLRAFKPFVSFMHGCCERASPRNKKVWKLSNKLCQVVIFQENSIIYVHYSYSYYDEIFEIPCVRDFDVNQIWPANTFISDKDGYDILRTY